MKITLAAVIPRRSRSKGDAFEQLVNLYVERAARYVPVDSQLFETETALLASLEAAAGRVRPFVVLLDSRGKTLSSEEFASTLSSLQDQGTQRLVLAIGPPDGWIDESRKQANLLFSLGRITLPHQLARVVLAEQIYRALTIIAGHPYHSGH